MHTVNKIKGIKANKQNRKKINKKIKTQGNEETKILHDHQKTGQEE